jgi:peptidyl-prolyl cis-trans isomerase SurA
MGEPGPRWGAPMLSHFTTCRGLLVAAMIVVAWTLPGTVLAQTVGAVADSEPITELEIQQRSRLNELSTRKPPARDDVIDELRRERLRIGEARKFGVEVTDSEDDETYAMMASRMRLTSEQLTGHLARAGVSVDALKHRIRADIASRRYQQWRRQDPPLRLQQDPPPRGRDDG